MIHEWKIIDSENLTDQGEKELYEKLKELELDGWEVFQFLTVPLITFKVKVILRRPTK